MPQQYLVVTTSPWAAPNGDIVPTGTAINSIAADPLFNPGPGLALAADTGQPWYSPPPAPPPTTIAVPAFIARFTPAEQTAIAGNPATLTFWLTLVAYPAIDTTDPRVTGGLAALVAANAFTAPRAAQIGNLAVASP